MKLIKTLPKEEGIQFVAVWRFNGEIWSDTYLIKNGYYLRYRWEDEIDGFIKEKYLPWDKEGSHFGEDCHFIIQKGNQG